MYTTPSISMIAASDTHCTPGHKPVALEVCHFHFHTHRTPKYVPYHFAVVSPADCHHILQIKGKQPPHCLTPLHTWKLPVGGLHH